jgi:hypothetical protein
MSPEQDPTAFSASKPAADARANDREPTTPPGPPPAKRKTSNLWIILLVAGVAFAILLCVSVPMVGALLWLGSRSAVQKQKEAEARLEAQNNLEHPAIAALYLEDTRPQTDRDLAQDEPGLLQMLPFIDWGNSYAGAATANAEKLKKISAALKSYHDQNKHFPPAAITDDQGKPLLSWRVAILPYLGEEKLYQQFHLNEPWDSEHNRQRLVQLPEVFRHPLAKRLTQTNLLVFRDKGSVFDGPGTLLQAIGAGADKTIMIVVAPKYVPWTEPEDVTFGANADLRKKFTEGCQVLMADGSVQSLKVDENTLADLIKSTGPKPALPKDELKTKVDPK